MALLAGEGDGLRGVFLVVVDHGGGFSRELRIVGLKRQAFYNVTEFKVLNFLRK